MSLHSKIEHSIQLIRRGEQVAMDLSPKGYHVGFSGGKDSQALLELVKMAGVKYVAEYSVTGNAPPDNVRFIRENYPEVKFFHPVDKFNQLIAKKGLPTMRTRYCCALLKEGRGAGMAVMTGVRAEESARRAKYSEVSLYDRRRGIGVLVERRQRGGVSRKKKTIKFI